jgi:hypothetical protein
VAARRLWAGAVPGRTSRSPAALPAARPEKACRPVSTPTQRYPHLAGRTAGRRTIFHRGRGRIDRSAVAAGGFGRGWHRGPVHDHVPEGPIYAGLTVAAATRPQLLILDEPVAALDPLARCTFLQNLMDSVAELQATVILSAHLLGDLERACDHLVCHRTHVSALAICASKSEIRQPGICFVLNLDSIIRDWHDPPLIWVSFPEQVRDNLRVRVRQLQFFTSAQMAVMRDRTARQNYSAEAEEFRREHARHREWGLVQRHGEKLRRLRNSRRDSQAASMAEGQGDAHPACPEPALLEQQVRPTPAAGAATGREVSRRRGRRNTPPGPARQRPRGRTGPSRPTTAETDRTGPARNTGSNRPGNGRASPAVRSHRAVLAVYPIPTVNYSPRNAYASRGLAAPASNAHLRRPPRKEHPARPPPWNGAFIASPALPPADPDGAQSAGSNPGRPARPSMTGVVIDAKRGPGRWSAPWHRHDARRTCAVPAGG